VGSKEGTSPVAMVVSGVMKSREMNDRMKRSTISTLIVEQAVNLIQHDEQKNDE
jgi:hypothetical protein